jgi:hypothetical protein
LAWWRASRYVWPLLGRELLEAKLIDQAIESAKTKPKPTTHYVIVCDLII